MRTARVNRDRVNARPGSGVGDVAGRVHPAAHLAERDPTAAEPGRGVAEQDLLAVVEEPPPVHRHLQQRPELVGAC